MCVFSSLWLRHPSRYRAVIVLTVGTSLLVSLSLSAERTKALILVDYQDSHPSEADTRKFLTLSLYHFNRADRIEGAVKSSLFSIARYKKTKYFDAGAVCAA